MSSIIGAAAASRCAASCPGLAQVLADTGAGGHGNRALTVAALICWLLTASIGGYMLSRLIASGGVAQQRANREGLSPKVLFWHFSLALSGLALWVSYVITSWPPLTWAAVALLGPVAGLGLSTVTLWAPYPTPGGPEPQGKAWPRPSSGSVTPPGPGCPALASTRSSVFSVCSSRRTCPDSWPRCGGWFGRAGYWR